MPNLDAYEWLDRNMHSNYPIADSCKCTANSGIVLPSSFLVDIDINVPKLTSIGGTDRFFISSIIRNGDYLIVQISYMRDSAVLCGRSAAIPISLTNSADIADRTFQIQATGDSSISELDKLSGTLIVGTCLDMQQYGTLTFDWNRGIGTTILSVRVHEFSKGLEKVEIIPYKYDNNNVSYADYDNTTKLYESFSIQAGDGVEFDISTDSEGGTVLIINRVPTDYEKEASIKSVEDVLNAVYSLLGNPIRRINGIAPLGGNFNIAGGDCVSIDFDGSSMTINNTCSKPCCSSSSVSDVEASLHTLEEACARLKEYYEAMTTRVNEMQSRLSSIIVSMH